MPVLRDAVKKRGIGKGRWWPRILLLGATGVVTALAGCSSMGITASTPAGKGDPLLGEFPPKQGPVQQATPPPKTSQGVPPIPPAHVSSSPAALAAGPLPGSRQLAINDQAVAQADTSTQIRRPEPLVQPLPRTNTPPGVLTTGSWTPAGQANDPLQAQLRARGVLWQRQENLPQGVKVTVMVPHRLNPDITRAYEAIARDYPSAVQAILQQIDAQR